LQAPFDPALYIGETLLAIRAGRRTALEACHDLRAALVLTIVNRGWGFFTGLDTFLHGRSSAPGAVFFVPAGFVPAGFDAVGDGIAYAHSTLIGTLNGFWVGVFTPLEAPFG